MTTNELIEDQIQKMNAYSWCEYLSKNPIHLSDFTPGQLNRLLSASQKWKQREEGFCASCLPPLNPKLNSRTWQDADFIEKSILAEFQRREPPKKKADEEKFADLFVSAEAMEKALEAARAVGLIEGNAWVYTGNNKVIKLRIWYTAALKGGLAKGGISMRDATNMVKEGIHFNSLHRDAVQPIPLLEIYRDHDNTYIYNTMLAIMKV